MPKSPTVFDSPGQVSQATEIAEIAGVFPSTSDRVVEPGSSNRPLCVDLDGTLVKNDTLIDSLLILARQHPAEALRVPGWILKGKAYVKAQVTELITLDVAHLPYNKPLLAYLAQEHGAGRRIFLATGADGELAKRVAAYLGFFEEVLASDGKTNLTGRDKLRSLEQMFPSGFDYIGNARPDIVLLEHAREAMVANPDRQLRAAIGARRFTVARRFIDQASSLRSLRKAMRVHQWAKNSLIFVPMFLAHTVGMPAFVTSLLAFFSFSFCASGTYILNDLLDIEADRRHPKKRFRPFAAGDLSAKTGVILLVALLVGSLGLALMLPRAFLGYLLLYLVSTVSYSFYLKRVVLVDVLLLSGLYTLRILAGAAASHNMISPWLAGFSVFLFFSLAIVKRFSELKNMMVAGRTPANGRGYLLDDVEQLRSFGTASAYASVVVFSMYISGRDVTALYTHPQRMWLITPLMLLWLSRVWLLASRGEMDEDPVIFAVTDKMSLLLGLAVLVIAFSAV